MTVNSFYLFSMFLFLFSCDSSYENTIYYSAYNNSYLYINKNKLSIHFEEEATICIRYNRIKSNNNLRLYISENTSQNKDTIKLEIDENSCKLGEFGAYIKVKPIDWDSIILQKGYIYKEIVLNKKPVNKDDLLATMIADDSFKFINKSKVKDGLEITYFLYFEGDLTHQKYTGTENLCIK